MISQTNQSHVFATVRAFDVEAGFLPSGTVMQCYISTVGSISKPTDTLEQARAFVRWHETQEGEIGEFGQYSIVRVSWDMAALAREEHGFVSDTGAQTVEPIESGVVYYAAAQPEQPEQPSAKYAYAYVVVGQEVFGLGDTVESALDDAAQYLEGGADEAQQRLSASGEYVDDGRAFVAPVSDARRYCNGGRSSILDQLGL